jgi:hypothetical protein
MRDTRHNTRKIKPLCVIACVDDLENISRKIHAELLHSAIRDKSSTSFVIVDGNEVYCLDTARLIGHYKVNENPRALVGVYSYSVTRDELLDDLRFSFIPC